jgi:hypothetical protein
VYFTAQASHLSHLAAKLGAAVDEAMAIPDQRRVSMIGEALARRFPSDVMIGKYRDVWQQVRGLAICDASCLENAPYLSLDRTLSI